MRDNQNEKSLIKCEKGIFSKMKNFFKRLFGKEEVVVIDSDNKLQEEVKNVGIIGNLKYNNESSELLELQIKFESGKIEEEDLSEEQVENLKELYKNQIGDLNQAIDNYKNRILKLKERLNNVKNNSRK